MTLKRFNLQCVGCGGTEYDVIFHAVHDVQPGERFPRCSCGGKRKSVNVSTGGATAIQGDEINVQIGSRRITSRAELRRTKRNLAAKHGGQTPIFESDNQARRNARANDWKHAVHERRRQKGIAPEDVANYDKMARSVRDEAAKRAAKRNENPNAAAREAAKQLPSLADQVGRKEPKLAGVVGKTLTKIDG